MSNSNLTSVVDICLIVDDHPLVCAAIEGLVRKSQLFAEVFTETEAFKALQLIKERNISFIILDVNLSDSDGFDFLRRAKAHGYKGKVLYVSASDASMYSETAFRLGADGYISKSEDLVKINDAIATIMSGMTVFRFLKDDDGNIVNSVKLSHREATVYTYLVEGHSNKDISNLLSLSTKTVSTYKTRILNKYKVKSIVELINLQSTLGQNKNID